MRDENTVNEREQAILSCLSKGREFFLKQLDHVSAAGISEQQKHAHLMQSVVDAVDDILSCVGDIDDDVDHGLVPLRALHQDAKHVLNQLSEQKSKEEAIGSKPDPA